jgi:hypothetical protein
MALGDGPAAPLGPGDQLGDGPLPCGHDADELYEHLRAGQLDDHERGCPDCQAAAAYLEPALRAVASLAAAPPEPPRGFAAAVMARVRSDPRRRRHLGLPAEPPLTVAITEHAAAAILSGAASSVSGLTSRGCTFPTPGDPAHLAIAVSIRYGLHAGPAIERLRSRLRAAALDQLGVTLRQVDIQIEDVDEP